MKRIAFVHNNFPAGGAERITIDIARYLKSIGGYQVYVYTTRVSPSLMTDEVRDLVNIRMIPSQAVQSRRSAAVEELLLQLIDEHPLSFRQSLGRTNTAGIIQLILQLHKIHKSLLKVIVSIMPQNGGNCKRNMPLFIRKLF